VGSSTLRKEKITASVLWAFSLVYLYGCLRLKLGTADNPGPGFIPALVGILLFLCTGAYLYRVFRGKRSGKEPSEESPEAEGSNYRAVGGIVGSIIFYIIGVGYLKFLVTTLIAIFWMQVFLRFKNLALCFLTAVAITLFSFVVFARLLGVSLPSGILEELIFRIGH
jgi:putative tricarboxylic transport membrane protein